MPKVSPAHMQARREQIVRAAIDEFSANGIHSTSMASIINTSGLSAGAIYTHFSSKDEIIAFASQTAIAAVFSGVEAALSDLPTQGEPEIFRLITNGIDTASVSPGFIVQVWAEAATNPEVRSTTSDAYAEALEFLSGYLSSGTVPRLRSDSEVTTSTGDALPRARKLLALVYAHIVQRAVLAEPGLGLRGSDVAAVLGS